MKNQDHLNMVVGIIHTANQLDYKISKVLKEFGVTHVQYNIIRILKGSYPKPLTVGEVKSRILFSNSDITRLIDRLEVKGIVDRTTNKDNRRKMDVLITTKGMELAEKIWPNIERKLDNLYEDVVTREEANMVADVLKKIRKDE